MSRLKQKRLTRQRRMQPRKKGSTVIVITIGIFLALGLLGVFVIPAVLPAGPSQSVIQEKVEDFWGDIFSLAPEVSDVEKQECNLSEYEKQRGISEKWHVEYVADFGGDRRRLRSLFVKTQEGEWELTPANASGNKCTPNIAE